MSRRDAFEAALNAVLGDYLEARESSLAIQMGLYRRGQPLDELPHGTAKLCVLVHGMACNERCWAYPDDPDTDYGVLLEKEHGLTPLYVRYNTGLTIRTSGQHLAALLQSVVDRSPVPVQELTLIGHSLGGLLIRSACHQGQQSSWLPLVRRAFYLGSPHLGSPLEKAGHVATSVLHAIDDPVVQLLGDLAEVRSAAVKDLRYGTLANDGAPVPLDERIEHYLVAGSLPGPLAALLGDGVVRVASATGVSASRAGAVDAVGLFPGLHHMAILHHPKVYAWIARRCGPAQPTIPVAPSLRAYPRGGRVGAYLELLEDAVDKGSSAVQEVHEAIAERTYNIIEAIPPLRAPSRAARAAHFRVLRGTYATLRLVNSLLGAVTNARADDEEAGPS
ncbi:MAG: alpha/beta hydrolase [Pseudomonadota bacterium]